MNNDEPTPTPPADNKSVDDLLDHLIDLLINRNEDIAAWMRALLDDPASSMDASGPVRKMIRLGAVADVDRALMVKITAAMALANGLEWSTEDVDKWVTAIYKDRQKRVENDRRIALRLPPID